MLHLNDVKKIEQPRVKKKTKKNKQPRKKIKASPYQNTSFVFKYGH